MKIGIAIFCIVLISVSCKDFFSHENDPIPVDNIHSRSTVRSHVNINTFHLTRRNLNINPVMDGVTISEIYARKEHFAGKKVKVKGIVTKFSADILTTNWVHLQDGTMYRGKFDMTVTTNTSVNEGDTVIFEGKITLHKDLGYGYTYEVLMEDATKIH